MAQETEQLLKLQQALAAKNLARVVDGKQSDDDEGGAEGGTAGGEGGVIVEKRLFVEAFGLIRNGEKEFGIAHDFDQMAYLAKENPNPLRGELGESQDWFSQSSDFIATLQI